MAMVSIITPVYKAESFLHRCVDSILNQTFPDFELILVDDGSPDNCGAICDEYAEKDGRVHVIHQANGGPAVARNTGIDWLFAHSDSQWLMFVDSDDWIHPEMLALLYHIAVENHVQISQCGYVQTEGETPEVPLKRYEATLYAPDDFYTSVLWGKLYHRNCFQEIRLPRGKFAEDEYTTYRILFQQEKIAVIDAPLYFYFHNADSVTHLPWSPRRLDALDALREQTDYFKKHGFARSYRNRSLDYAAAILEQRKNVADSVLSPEEKQKNDRYLLRCLRKAVWDYKDIYLRCEHRFFLEAYPSLTIIYRIYQTVKGLWKGEKV